MAEYDIVDDPQQGELIARRFAIVLEDSGQQLLTCGCGRHRARKLLEGAVAGAAGTVMAAKCYLLNGREVRLSSRP
jgi:hypothetical protein